MALYGRILGIPYDFRRPTWSKLKSHYWNPDDERIFIPRAFGIGWDINLYKFRERYPVFFWIAVSLTVLSTVIRHVAVIRSIIKKRHKEEE
ncbi:MAG TPA: DUF5808 domain-containing protein [Candidatus Anoxymicrobiaceae bacterium]